MRVLLKAISALSILGVAAAASGCVITTTDNTPSTGDLVVSWDIQGSQSAAACNSHLATEIQIRLYDTRGYQVGNAQYRMACSTFATSIFDLPRGTYTLQAELLDSAGRPRTTTAGAPPASPITLYIYGNQTTNQPVSFPDSSFK